MNKNIFRSIKKVIEITLILFVVIFVESSSNKKEIKVLNDNYNKAIDLSTMALKLKEDIANDLYSAKDTFTGDLTGYGADCALCTGRLACLPNYNVLDGTDTYQDMSYGKVRIVASSKNLSCGTIIRFTSSRLSSEPILAIVLDRGVLGNDIDLLTPSEAYALNNVGRTVITYDVLRNGW